MRRDLKSFLGWSALLLGVAFAAPAAAQTWPSKPVHLTVPFAPGAAADTIARLMGAKLSALWGQSVVVENRPGGGTIVGTQFVAKQPADGYSLLLITPSFIINATGARKLPYDSVKDFAPVTLFASTAEVLVVTPSLPVNSVKELMDLAKAKPYELNFGSSGIGSPTQLGLEMFKMYGSPMTHIPYSGGGPALTALLGGQVQMLLTSIFSVQPMIKEGRLKALAVTTPKRSPIIPDVPAMAETIPGYDVENWWGIIAPAGTPQAVTRKIADDLRSVLEDPEMRAKLSNEGADPVGSNPDEFGAYIRDDIARWTKVVKETGAKID